VRVYSSVPRDAITGTCVGGSLLSVIRSSVLPGFSMRGTLGSPSEAADRLKPLESERKQQIDVLVCICGSQIRIRLLIVFFCGSRELTYVHEMGLNKCPKGRRGYFNDFCGTMKVCFI